MKEKMLAFLLYTGIVIYLKASMWQSHKKWPQGITVEEQNIEDELIW